MGGSASTRDASTRGSRGPRRPLADPRATSSRAAIGVRAARACGRSERRQPHAHERRPREQERGSPARPLPIASVRRQQYGDQRADQRAEDPRVRAHVRPIRVSRLLHEVCEPPRGDEDTGYRHGRRQRRSAGSRGGRRSVMSKQRYGPDHVELLLDGERPHVLERALVAGRLRSSRSRDEVPVGDVRQRRSDVGPSRRAGRLAPSGTPGDHRCITKNERRSETTDSTRPEVREASRPALDLRRAGSE